MSEITGQREDSIKGTGRDEEIVLPQTFSILEGVPIKDKALKESIQNQKTTPYPEGQIFWLLTGYIASFERDNGS
jgi:hypothetical protein